MDTTIRAAASTVLLPFKRRKPAFSGTLLRSGNFELRLASTKREIRKAQRLRYKIFFEDGAATPDRTAALIRRDVCPFDRFCDHLLVVDHAHRNRWGKRKPKIVGAYRLLRDEIAARHGGFYSATEFDVAPLLARHPGKRFLELGRACVAASHRNRHTLDLLWRGIGLYIRHHAIDVLIGCASLPGTDPSVHAAALRFLTVDRRAEDEWLTRARASQSAAFAALEIPAVDARLAIAALPPLIKGYLRCGATFGEGVVIDAQFGTTDVFAVMPVARINARTLAHFAPPPRALTAA